MDHDIRNTQRGGPMDCPTWLKKAKLCWEEKRGLEAGEIIAGHIPEEDQPGWGGRILALMTTHANVAMPLLQSVQQLSTTPSDWEQGHDVFDKVREVTLRYDATAQGGDDDALGWILAVAELTTKVSYNATHPMDPFDEDSAAWIVDCLLGYASLVDAVSFYEQAWQVACEGLGRS